MEKRGFINVSEKSPVIRLSGYQGKPGIAGWSSHPFKEKGQGTQHFDLLFSWVMCLIFEHSKPCHFITVTEIREKPFRENRSYYYVFATHQFVNIPLCPEHRWRSHEVKEAISFYIYSSTSLPGVTADEVCVAVWSSVWAAADFDFASKGMLFGH